MKWFWKWNHATYLDPKSADTRHVVTAIVRQIPVARKLKLLFGDCADARNKIAESLWKQNYADAVHVLRISSSLWILCLNYLKFWHDLYGVADLTQKSIIYFLIIINKLIKK